MNNDPKQKLASPLATFRVLDLTRFLAGPYCTQVLAQFGADVVKIEQPVTGDDSRRLAPKVHGESYPFAMPNHSKRSVALDLKSDRGRDLFLRMAAQADCVIENFRPGVTRRLGISYEHVTAVNPGVIYCSISGFGQTGPYRDRPGFDIMAQGHTGFMRMTGHPGGPPTKIGIAINDIAAGSAALYSILAAQVLRQRTGTGQYIDVSLVDAGLAWTIWESGAYFATGELPEPSGTRHRRSAPYQAFRTSDGYVTIGAANDRLWERLVVEVLERPAWLEDPRYDTFAARMQHVDELAEQIDAITRGRTTAEWVQRLDTAGVPGGPVYTYDEALSDAHVQSRGMVVELEHPIMGPMRTIGPPVKFSDAQFGIRRPAPWLGQHTREVLSDVGVEELELDDLFAAGVAYDAHPDRHGTSDE